MPRQIKVVQFGLGPIGVRSARLAAAKSGLKLIGAVDIDPAKLGHDVGELDGGDAIGVRVSDDIFSLLKRARPDVVLHTTSSSFASVLPQLETLAAAGVSVVSSTEELLFPALRNPALARKLDRLAAANGAALLGTGVNPGFVMDTLALALSAVCYDVRAVRVERRVDAATRRKPLQLKVGAGLTVAQFNERKARNAIGHVGLGESMALIAHGLCWPIDRLEEGLEPVVATRMIRTPFLAVRRGEVAGIHNTGRVISGGREVISLDLQMYVGAKGPADVVELDSTPPIRAELSGGVAGDFATAAMLVNLAPRVVEMARTRPGLRLMTDFVCPRCLRSAQ